MVPNENPINWIINSYVVIYLKKNMFKRSSCIPPTKFIQAEIKNKKKRRKKSNISQTSDFSQQGWGEYIYQHLCDRALIFRLLKKIFTKNFFGIFLAYKLFLYEMYLKRHRKLFCVQRFRLVYLFTTCSDTRNPLGTSW